MSTSNKNTEERQPFVLNWTSCFLHSCQKWRVLFDALLIDFRYVIHLICCSQCSFFFLYLLISHIFQYRLIGIYIRSFDVVISFSTKAKGSRHSAARLTPRSPFPQLFLLLNDWIAGESWTFGERRWRQFQFFKWHNFSGWFITSLSAERAYT